MELDIQHESADKIEVENGASHPLFSHAPANLNFKKTRKRLLRETRQVIDDYGMDIEPEKWLVCMSGGKDSYSLLAILLDLKWRGLLQADLLACNLDQAQPGFPQEVLPNFFKQNAVEYVIEREDTYSIVTEKIEPGGTYCSLCSRLRRGHLYRIARENNCQAVVLGHHRDDILETFFLNFFYGGRMATMPAKLLNQDGDLKLYRPLSYCSEKDIAKFANWMNFPIIPCDLCGSQEGLQRQKVKEQIAEWEKLQPGRSNVMFRALSNIRPSHLLDRKLFDFDALSSAS